ncbi:MAG: uracil phosphoribosyltransferase [Deltaproteobacteria bacterium]|nr:uracil phosphoribosyltransferase [Deltaproteobacteria bacterium]
MSSTGESLYREVKNCISGEFKHLYGDHVHILKDPWALTLLASMSSPQVAQPDLDPLIRLLYERLLGYVVSAEFPLEFREVPTRMAGYSFGGNLVSSATRVVVLDLLRAGMMPAHYSFLSLLRILPNRHIRVDHLCVERVTDRAKKVRGSDVLAAKVGGNIDNTIVFLPDPMGATGNSVKAAVHYYRAHGLGKAAKWIIANLIVTPEHIEALSSLRKEENVVLYAFRLDRGGSEQEVFSSVPGKHRGRERGLNEVDYIIPGAGGIGELLNNTEK